MPKIYNNNKQKKTKKYVKGFPVLNKKNIFWLAAVIVEEPIELN
jgi:hypothetical protein